MNFFSLFSFLTAKRRMVSIVFGCAVGAAIAPSASARNGDALTLQPLAEPAAKLPVSTHFEKKGSGEGPQYVLHVKNVGNDVLEISAECELSVTVHAGEKSRSLPARHLAAGETWTIPDLASLDKVVLSAKGYASLHLVVP